MSWNYIASQSLQSAKDWWIGIEMTSMNYISGMHNNWFETALYANRVQSHFILHLPCTDGLTDHAMILGYQLNCQNISINNNMTSLSIIPGRPRMWLKAES